MEKTEIIKKASELVDEILYNKNIVLDEDTMDCIEETIKEFVEYDGMEDVNEIIKNLNLEELY